MSELQSSFVAFCNSQKKGSEKASDKVLKKLFTDAGVFHTLSLTSCDMDIAVAAFKGREKIKGDLSFDQFCGFLGQFCQEAEKRGKVEVASATEALLRERIAASRPVAHGATAVSRDGATSRLTDVKSFTGQHRERFDANTGRGRGREGREFLPDKGVTEGYVNGYKGMSTYSKQ